MSMADSPQTPAQTPGQTPAPDFLFDGPAEAAVTVVLAHGAGAPMDSPVLQAMAEGLAGAGLRVARFEFPYMAARRTGGKKRPPDPERRLLATWRAAAEALGEPGNLILGGKSMGGRMASLVADELGAGGLACLGYPFHPPGKPDKLRTAHLEALATPTVVVQGERDPFGRRDEVEGPGVEGYALSPRIRLVWAPDGDHDLKPRKASGHTHEANIALAVAAVVALAREIVAGEVA
jgi:predicted alpha/beta-hydrolase family hydrolase